MNQLTQLGELDLAALVSSKVCHDAIGPMTAIGFGLDTIDDEDDETRTSAIGLIRDGVGKITAKLQFARLAFGAAGSSGYEINVGEAESVARSYVEIEGKHKLEWHSDLPSLPKNQVKLLLNLVAIALGTVPRGGTVFVAVTAGETGGRPEFHLRCTGPAARIPNGVLDLLAGTPAEEVDARSIQPYLAGRLARSSGYALGIELQGEAVIVKAKAQ
jgi:histidine phosphotransferase ChpT